MSKDIKKALEHCIEWNCADCPNREELGSGEIVCRGRLLPQVLQYISDLQHRLEVAEKALSKAVNDKCKAENIIAESIVGKGAKVAVPKKEQWYLEQSEKEIKGEKNE